MHTFPPASVTKLGLASGVRALVASLVTKQGIALKYRFGFRETRPRRGLGFPRACFTDRQISTAIPRRSFGQADSSVEYYDLANHADACHQTPPGNHRSKGGPSREGG
jgi:hypothetical protein